MRRLPVELDELARELPLTLTKEQALEILHMTERTFARAVRSGELKIVKLSPGRSGRVLVTRSELVRFMGERIV